MRPAVGEARVFRSLIIRKRIAIARPSTCHRANRRRRRRIRVSNHIDAPGTTGLSAPIAQSVRCCWFQPRPLTPRLTWPVLLTAPHSRRSLFTVRRLQLFFHSSIMVAETKDIKGTVLVYSIVGCPRCMKAKNRLTECGLPYKEVSLDTFPQVPTQYQPTFYKGFLPMSSLFRFFM